MNSEETEKKKSKHTFLKNNQYFTICIYTFCLVVVCAIAIRSIIFIDETQAFIGGILRAIAPFMIALLIAYVLTPAVRLMKKLIRRVTKLKNEKLNAILSMLIVYLLTLGFIVALLVYVLPEVVNNLMDLVKMMPDIYNRMMDFIGTLEERFPNIDFSSFTDMITNVQGDLSTGLSDIAANMIPVLYTASVSVVTWAANFLIAIILSIYMLYGKKSLLRLLKICMYGFLPEEKRQATKEILIDCNRIFSQYLVSKMLDSLIIGILCAILMSILRLPYVLLISLVVGVTNMIPYFGPFIGAVPGVIIILCISPIKALIFAAMILALQQFDGWVLGPKLMGSSTGMKPLWIIFAITVGGKFFGVLGMFLGVPVMAILSYLAERYMNYRLHRKGMSIEEIP